MVSLHVTPHERIRQSSIPPHTEPFFKRKDTYDEREIGIRGRRVQGKADERVDGDRL